MRLLRQTLNSSSFWKASCYLGENFLEIYGRSSKHEIDEKWADVKMALDLDLDLWKRIARYQALRIEEGPSLASLISDEPSTTLIYGVLIGIFAGCILPTWMFFLILIGTVWYIVNRMPPAMVTVIKSTLEGAMSGRHPISVIDLTVMTV